MKPEDSAGLVIMAYEFGAYWPVYLSGEVPSIGETVVRDRLYYADVKQPVPRDAELTVIHELGQQHRAEALAEKLRDADYADVTTCVNVHAKHEHGEPVG